MQKNIGTKDRLVRLLIALIFGVAILFTDILILKIILALASLFSLFEALSSWCAFYALIGKNTCPVPLRKRKKG